MKILIISAHPDDIEMSMGSTLAKLALTDNDHSGLDHETHTLQIHILSSSHTIDGNAGITKELGKSLHGIYDLQFHLHEYPTMHFQEHYQAIRDDVFRIKQEFNPDVVYCKSPNAIHPDHRVIGEACESIFLECSVYAMEGIRDGQNQKINKWVSINAEDLNTKINAIKCYTSQTRRKYSDQSLIDAWARFRGAQVGVQFAEGFEVIREVS